MASIAFLGSRAVSSAEAVSDWLSEESASDIVGPDRALIIASIAILGCGAISSSASESLAVSSTCVAAR
eukprot:CAMPEP_0181029116 /NCGR_PEP_ID=MMETSP1070-20121207/5025_1 /TAXON_ID=265543 /ORGANISM="Minutocellus polymorphus, Strain NH13" /LENGTH=68 /DNA_ID=CAMNT_0023106401 /DNA_START=48 /DNA_END=251 /DNA_ORIENTATION=-